MSIHAPRPASDPARDAHRARVAEHMAALKEISDLAVELAKALGRQAIVAAQAGGEVAETAEKSFSRATRTVRLTAALDVRLSESLLAKDEADEGGVEDKSGEAPHELFGVAQRLREALRPWMVPEPGEESEGREREARERLVETEGDGVLLGRADGSETAAAPLPRPAGGPPPATGEELGAGGAAANSPPPLGERDHAEHGGGGSPSAAASEPEGKARGP